MASSGHHDQKRKGTDIPYISHPMSVALILADFGATDNAIIAGILHDTVEDSELTLEDVREQFGQRITEIVAACSEPDKNLEWEDRKKHTNQVLRSADSDVWMVTCADKFHNVSMMLTDYKLIGDILWKRFNRGKDQQKWYFTELLKSLAPGSHYCPPLYQLLQAPVNELFPE